MELVADLTLVLVAALAGGFLAQQLRQPLIVGYIVAGVVVGPFTGGFTVAHVHQIEQLAELGVALLLFSLGLEVSFRDLAPVRAVAIAGVAIQLTLSIALGFGLAIALDQPWQPALWFGSLIALSSTMVALKTLQAQGRLGTLSSRVMLGMLVVQDLAVLPLMIVLPELSAPGSDATRVLIAIGRSLVLLAVIIFIAIKIVPRLMGIVARWNSRELFLLATTTLAIGIGYAASALGLSLALGAFIAGLVINESEYAHQALSDIIPLRDIFGMLFFVSVGMLLNPALVVQQAQTLIVVVLIVFVGKAAIFGFTVRAFGYRRIVPLATALTLFQVGEFAFVLVRVGVTAGIISSGLYSLVLNTAVATMALTPVISGTTPWIYRRFAGRTEAREPLQTANIPERGLVGHVVVAGAGRVGRAVAEAIGEAGKPCVLVELDARRMEQARQAGLPVVYGDATQEVVLEAARLRDARALLVTVPALVDVRAILEAARRIRADVDVVARAESADAVRALRSAGVSRVTFPEFEAGMEMAREALAALRVPADQVQRAAAKIRQTRYDGGQDT